MRGMNLSFAVAAATALPLACGDDGRVDSGTDGTSSSTPTTMTGATTSGSTSSNATSNATDDPTTAGSETGTATTGTSGPTTSGTTGPVDETSTGAPTCADTPTCTDDLKGLVCDGEVVQVCDDGAYCIDGACTPLAPCEAAALLKGSEGCDFWAVKTEISLPGSCFAAFIANTWDEPVHIEVEHDGQSLSVADFTRIPQGQGQGIVYAPYDAQAGLPVGEVALVFLSRGPGGEGNLPACPAPPGVDVETAVLGTGRGAGFHISTDRPVAAYQMLPYGSGNAAITSATLLLPTSVWDTGYIVANAYKQSVAVPAARPLFAVVAMEDATEISLDPTAAIVGGPNVPPAEAGVLTKYTLDRGETIQFNQSAELTGSPLVASKPVGVFGGATCFNVPVDASFCDGGHQQLPPIKALGSEYVAVRYRNRTNADESPPWRMVGVVDGTQLTWDPAKPAGAPDTLDLGQIAEFNSPGPFAVRSQDGAHPFYLAGYMTGGNVYGGRGDPEWVNVVPAQQYLDRYVFFTDPTYSETSIVVVRRKQDGAFGDVTLECAGVLGGWQPVDADHEYTRVDLVTGNFEDVGGCSNGRHVISSESPIGVTVWGWGSPDSVGFKTINVSYAYPAGAAIRAINDVKVTPG
jgi:hypothetical protein